MSELGGWGDTDASHGKWISEIEGVLTVFEGLDDRTKKLVVSTSDLTDVQIKMFQDGLSSIGKADVAKTLDGVTDAMGRGTKATLAYGTVLEGLKAKLIGAATAAKNFIIANPYVAIAGAVAGVLIAINSYRKHQEQVKQEAIEAADEAGDSIQNIRSELEQTIDLVDSATDSFIELSKGVDKLTGANKSLTTEQYEEFLEVSNKLADTFPTLDRVYDENGNAIVDLGNSTAEATQKLSELEAEARRIANIEISEKFGTLLEGSLIEAEDYQKAIDDAESVIQAINDYQNITGDNEFSLSVPELDYASAEKLYKAMKTILNDFGIQYTSFFEENQSTGLWRGTFALSQEDEKRVQDDLKAGFGNLVSQQENELVSAEADLEVIYSDIVRQHIAWLQTNPVFEELDAENQAAAQKILQGLDIQSLINSGVLDNTAESWENFSNNQLLPLFNNLPNLGDVFDADAMFSAGEMDYSKYKDVVGSFYEELDKALEEGVIDDVQYSAISNALGNELADAMEKAIAIGLTPEAQQKIAKFIEDNNIHTVEGIRNLIAALGGENARQLTDRVEEGLESYKETNFAELLGGQIDSLAARMTTYKDTLSVVETAQAELNETGVLTEETASALTAEFGDLDSVLKMTAKGWEIDAKAVDEYSDVQQALMDIGINGYLIELDEQIGEVDAAMTEAAKNGEIDKSLRDKKDSLNELRQSLLDVASQYLSLNSSYNKFLASFDNTDAWDPYDQILSKADSVREMMDNGFYGDDSVKAFAQMFSAEDLSEISYSDLMKAAEEAWAKYQKYFTETTQGAQNLVKELDALGYVFEGNLNIDNTAEAAERLGVDIGTLYVMLENLKRAGMDIDTSEFWLSAGDSKSVLSAYDTLIGRAKALAAANQEIPQSLIDGLTGAYEQLRELKDAQKWLSDWQLYDEDFKNSEDGKDYYEVKIRPVLEEFEITEEQLLNMEPIVDGEAFQQSIDAAKNQTDADVVVGMDQENSTLSTDIDAVADEPRTVDVSITQASVDGMKSQLDNVFKDRTIKVAVDVSGLPGVKPKESKSASTPAEAFGSYAKGKNGHTTGYAGKGLVGELGEELLVRDGVATPIGVDGAEIIDIKKDDIIFNHEQTKELAKHGCIKSRGRAYSKGTMPAYQVKGSGTSVAKGDPGFRTVSKNAAKEAEEAAKKAAKAAEKDSEKVKDNAEESYDYFESMIQVLEAGVSYIDSVLENLNGSMAKNPLIDKQMDYVRAEIDGYAQALEMYQGLANEALAKLPADIQAKIKAGAIEVAKYIAESDADETIVSMIDDYTQWDDKVQECRQSIEEQTTALKEMAKLKFDNIIEDFETISDIFNNSNDLVSKQIDFVEEAGLQVGEEFYRAQASNSRKLLENLQSELNAATQAFTQALNSGEIRKGDEQYLEMLDTINDLDGAIIEAKTDIEAFNNEILQLKWDRFDSLQEQFENIDDELSHLYDLFSDETDIKVSDRHGTWTDEALAQLGLLAQQYELNKNQSEQYAKAQDELERMYRSGQYTTSEYIEKLAELKDGQWDAIEAYKAAENAIMSLNEVRIEEECEAIQEEIDAFKELTDAQIEALEAAEDLHDYQMSIKEQTKDIADIERQLAAMQNDNTAATVARRKQLEEELAEARQELAETERDHAHEEQVDALNEQYEAYEKSRQEEMEALRKTLEDRENIIYQSMNQVKDNATVIGDQINQMAKEHGVDISETIVGSWDKGSDAIAGYNEVLSASTSAFIGELDSVEAAAERLQRRADELAESLAYAFSFNADTLVSQIQSSYDSIKDVSTPADVWIPEPEANAQNNVETYTFRRPEPGLVEAYDGSGNLVGTYTLDEAKQLFGDLLKFAKGGLVEKTNSPLNRIAQAVGEDTLVAAKVGEAILSPEQTKAMLQLAPILSQFKSALESSRRSGMLQQTERVASNNSFKIDSLVNVEGDVTDDNADKIAKVAQDTINRFMTKWNRDIKYNGYR